MPCRVVSGQWSWGDEEEQPGQEAALLQALQLGPPGLTDADHQFDAFNFNLDGLIGWDQEDGAIAADGPALLTLVRHEGGQQQPGGVIAGDANFFNHAGGQQQQQGGAMAGNVPLLLDFLDQASGQQQDGAMADDAPPPMNFNLFMEADRQQQLGGVIFNVDDLFGGQQDVVITGAAPAFPNLADHAGWQQQQSGAIRGNDFAGGLWGQQPGDVMGGRW